MLQNLAITDFGNYSCMADNSLGRDRGFIQLSGEEGQFLYSFLGELAGFTQHSCDGEGQGFFYKAFM